MSLPDEIFGVRQPPLKPLYGGRADSLRSLRTAKTLLREAIDDAVYSDWVDSTKLENAMDYLEKVERDLS